MTTQEQPLPSVQIVHAMRDLRNGKITDEEFRTLMASLRERLGEREYNRAKFMAALGDR